MAKISDFANKESATLWRMAAIYAVLLGLACYVLYVTPAHYRFLRAALEVPVVLNLQGTVVGVATKYIGGMAD